MNQIKFNFIETPEKILNVADALMPHLSNLSASDLKNLKGGMYRSCDAVCLPPGYAYTCDAKPVQC